MGKLFVIAGALHLPAVISEVHRALRAGETEDGDVVALVVLDEFLDLRERANTGATPGRPEVDHDNVALHAAKAAPFLAHGVPKDLHFGGFESDQLTSAGSTFEHFQGVVHHALFTAFSLVGYEFDGGHQLAVGVFPNVGVHASFHQKLGIFHPVVEAGAVRRKTFDEVGQFVLHHFQLAVFELGQYRDDFTQTFVGDFGKSVHGANLQRGIHFVHPGQHQGRVEPSIPLGQCLDAVQPHRLAIGGVGPEHGHGLNGGHVAFSGIDPFKLGIKHGVELRIFQGEVIAFFPEKGHGCVDLCLDLFFGRWGQKQVRGQGQGKREHHGEIPFEVSGQPSTSRQKIAQSWRDTALFRPELRTGRGGPPVPGGNSVPPHRPPGQQPGPVVQSGRASGRSDDRRQSCSHRACGPESLASSSSSSGGWAARAVGGQTVDRQSF